jgi:hypothetical protein
LETAARSDDTGIYHGSMHWSFKMDAGKVSEEKWHVTEGVSHTFLSAVDEFNKFYKNTYTVMAGDTLASIDRRIPPASDATIAVTSHTTGL